MQPSDRKPLHHYWQPRYWPIWLGIALLRLSCLLPHRRQIRLGEWLGAVAHRVAGKRRAIARRNIQLCLPELSARERNRLALEHFKALGASAMEAAFARWSTLEEIAAMTTVVGAEHLERTRREGHNVILLGGHFTTVEISGRMMSAAFGHYDFVYRKFRNPLLTELLLSSRERFSGKAIDKNDIKSMMRSLRAGVPVWYAADQSFHRKPSALVPFFGVPAMTNLATGTLAKLGRAKAVPVFPRRLPGGGYELTVLPPIDGLPSDDPVADAARYMAVIERQVRRCPEQYYWVHKRFKRRPEPLPDVYADLDDLK